jgi:hypothetical protein
MVDPQVGKAAARQAFNGRLSEVTGRGFAANIDVAIGHDCNPHSGDMG